MAASKWIDTAFMVDDQRLQYLSKGPNGQLIFQCDTDDQDQINALERKLNDKLGPDGLGVVAIGSSATIVSQRTAEELGYDVAHDK